METKLSLSTDFGSPEHWKRMLDFASRFGVSRLVYWGDSARTRFYPPLLYPKYATRIGDTYRRIFEETRKRFVEVARLTREAGLEFWVVYQVLQLPNPDIDPTRLEQNISTERARALLPEMFGDRDEPDMADGFVYQFLRDQLDEYLELVPDIAGFEMWVMECASLRIAHLKQQTIDMQEICTRIISTVYDHLHADGRSIPLAQDLHTTGGDTRTLHSLLSAATEHPDIILGADNCIGDYTLHLPFNTHLIRASQTNPFMVNFDLNGEYWGRNYVPTAAFRQYESHIEECLQYRPRYINGRIATEHNILNPHANVLPSRRQHYPTLQTVSNEEPLPTDLEIPCTDSIGAVNAEYVCRKVQDPSLTCEDVVSEFLTREFGPEAAGLTPVFMKLEAIAGKIFYIDKNNYHGQSLLCSETFIPVYALDVHMTAPEGTPIPNDEIFERTNASWHPIAFAGWPLPKGHQAGGPHRMLKDKEDAVRAARACLDAIEAMAGRLAGEDYAYLHGMFEDYDFFARAFRHLIEFHLHFYHLKRGRQNGPFPDLKVLEETRKTLLKLAAEWTSRYPGDRYAMASTLTGWADAGVA
jgi:hypothetical protein